MLKKTLTILTISAGLALSAVPASASLSWHLINDCISGCTNSVSNGNTRTSRAKNSGSLTNSYNVISSGWSNSGSSSTMQNARLKAFSGGLGIQNRGESSSSPDHSVDNSGYKDSVLFDFGSKSITLDYINLGWANGSSNRHADLTVLAYTGGGTPGSINGASDYTGLVANGWEVVTHLYNSYSYNFNSGPGAISSTNWLVLGANTGLGASWDGHKDYFKIKKLGGTKHSLPPPPGGGGVPAPGVVWLLMGGLGFMSLRRAQTQA